MSQEREVIIDETGNRLVSLFNSSEPLTVNAAVNFKTKPKTHSVVNTTPTTNQ